MKWEESELSRYFARFRKHVTGIDQSFKTPYGSKKILYADWTASGRLYSPIEEKIHQEFGPFVGNTHTETTVTGTAMTLSYHKAKEIIKHHINAGPEDVLLMCGAGMTAGVVRLQRILGLKIPEQAVRWMNIPQQQRPVVFITHMEHHSNHTTWLETIADVVIIRAASSGRVDLEHFQRLLEQYADRETIIAAVSACSNVTGIQPPYQDIARMVHQVGGLCFVDFACSAPYVQVDMHPDDKTAHLDAIYFSPHKFLGGPGSAGALVFHRSLYRNKAPDRPGGGTVTWTNAWNQHAYYEDIETREDGGTPAFLQTIRAALCIRLKEEMGIENMLQREEEIVRLIFDEFETIPGLHILEKQQRHRLGVVSFWLEEVHYNLAVRILNDRFGIQMRGGCACAGTYGHFLFYIRKTESKRITDQIDRGDLSEKPGFIRFSVNPTLSNAEIGFICDAVRQVVQNHREWSADYIYDEHSNEFRHKDDPGFEKAMIDRWFSRVTPE